MERQLTLLGEDTRPWHLDDETRAIGRAGVEEARRALREALARAADQRQAA